MTSVQRKLKDREKEYNDLKFWCMVEENKEIFGNHCTHCITCRRASVARPYRV